MEINLVFIKKDRTTQSFKLPSAVTFIGRRQDCDLCIPLSVVSRRHCELYTEFDKIMVRDLNSRNGTLVNGEPIQEAQIKAGDTLRIGPILFIVQADGVPESFEEYMPTHSEDGTGPEPAAPTSASQAETQEADFEDLMEDSENIIGGQSQTMDIDDVFKNDFLGDDDFDLGADIPD